MMTLFFVPATGFACQKLAVAWATRSRLLNVKSSAMTARQPSVPNLICPMTSTPDSRLFVHDLLHLAQRRLEVPMLEKPGAADKGVRAGMGALSGGLKIDSAVHLDTVVEILLFSPRVSLLNFGECFGNEWLPAETRIDR